MIQKEIADGLWIVCTTEPGNFVTYNGVFKSIEEVCEVANIEPDILIDILEGRRKRHNFMKFKCIDGLGNDMPVRYKNIETIN